MDEPRLRFRPGPTSDLRGARGAAIQCLAGGDTRCRWTRRSEVVDRRGRGALLPADHDREFPGRDEAGACVYRATRGGRLEDAATRPAAAGVAAAVTDQHAGDAA